MSKKTDKLIEIKRNLMEQTFLVLDIETTGFSPEKGGMIIEIGALLIYKNKAVRKFHQLINPGIKIPKKITEITKITNDDIKDKPVYGNILPDFYKTMINNDNTIIVGHNISFDWDRFLKYFFYNVGILANNKTVDTKELFKICYPEEKKCKLEDLCSKLGIINYQAHNALKDTEATARCFMKLKEKFLNENQELSVTINQQKKSNDKIIFNKNNLKIGSILYWEKDITKKKKHQRVFVNGNFGTAYFDLISKSWYIKDLKSKYIDQASVDLHDLEQLVFNQLKVNSREEFTNYYLKQKRA